MRIYLLFLVALTGAAFTTNARAASVCYNNVCGKIVCERGCVQRAVNGVCVANYCVGWNENDADLSADFDWDTDEALDSSEAARSCVSCNRGCCHRGRSFLDAERRCKAHHGPFGCFTRC